MTDVLAITTRIARILDPIAQEHRATVIQILRDRYQLGGMTGAERKRRFEERWRTGTERSPVTEPENENGTGTGNATAPASFEKIVFKIPESIEQALRKSRILGQASALWNPLYWQAEVRANPGVNFAAEILKAEAWMISNPDRAPRKNFGRFLHTWLSKSERNE